MNIFIPRDAWPSAIAAQLVLGQLGRELDRAERVERHRHHRRARRGASRPSRVVHLHLAAALRDRRHRRARRRSNGAAAAIACSSAPRSADDRHPAAGVLGQREAVARQRVPAQHRDRAGIVQRRVGQRLELGAQHVALLRVELELVDALGDRQPVEARQLVDREQRIVGLRAAPSARRRRTGPSRAGRSRRAPRSSPVRRSPPTYQAARSASSPSAARARPARVISENVCGWCQCTQAPPYSIWCPSHRRVQVRPPSRSRASSNSTERPRSAALARRGDAGEAAADDDHVVHERPLAADRSVGHGPRDRRASAPPRRRRRPAPGCISTSSSRARPAARRRARPAAPPRRTSTRRAGRGRRAASARRAATAAPARSGRRRRAAARSPRRRAARSRSRPARSPARARPRRCAPPRSARPRAGHPLGQHLAAVLGGQRGQPAVRVADRRADRSSPSTTPPSSDLCWTAGELSFSAIGPPSSASAATASSSSATTARRGRRRRRRAAAPWPRAR